MDIVFIIHAVLFSLSIEHFLVSNISLEFFKFGQIYCSIIHFYQSLLVLINFQSFRSNLILSFNLLAFVKIGEGSSSSIPGREVP